MVMRRLSSSSILVFVVAFGMLAGCKRGEQTHAPDAPAPQPKSSGGQGGGPAALLPGATCTFPARLDHDETIKAGCVVDVTKSALVENGSTLTIEPGARLRFAQGTFLEVGHKGSKLVARGTKERPVVFTSGEAKPKRGDWVGLVIDDTVGNGSSLEHAIVEYAGQATHGGHGALTVFRTQVGSSASSGKLAVRDVTFRSNDTAAVSDPDGRNVFSAFEGNVFQDNARAMRVAAPVLTILGDGNDIDDLEVVGGTIDGKATWPKTKRGIFISEPVYVNGQGDRVGSLTIARGAVLRFAPKTWLEVGTGGPAELVAQGVTFTSAEPLPKAGDWVGLFFGDKTRHALVSDSTIEYAGAEEHNGDAAVTFVGSKSWQALDVNFSFVTFKQISQAHFSSNGDGCDKALDPRHGITWAGMLEPCR